MQPKKKWGWKTGKTPVKTTPKSDLKKRIAALDRVFSQYVRLRDSNSSGVFFCITCNRPVYYKDGDAGHFVQRNRMATRFDPKNVNGQCKKCNRFDSGRQHEHGKAIDKKYGEGTADHLMLMGKVRGAKLDIFLVEHMIKEYRKKVKELSCKLCNI